jgi:hypothetical protein
MNFLNLTRLSLTLQGEVKENVIFVNPQHIRVFSEEYADNFEMFVTAISWANGSFMETRVKETPHQIESQLKICLTN